MKKILLIDDSDTYIWRLQKYLQRRGYPVETASTLKEARTAIQEEMPLVICCDLDLPDGTAMELFHALRRVEGMFQMKNPPVRLLPFFILTENGDLATEYEYRHEGVNDYITAPVNIPELIRRIMYFVEDSK
ncbi:response regulator [bacterium 1xD8-48]|nr:response regulator [bacterium 1xD8-48]